MASNAPRVVVITRETEYEMLLARHATRGQAECFLRERDQSIDELDERHRRFIQALHRIMAAIPRDWRRNRVQRADLDRFLFEPEDLIVAVGQDGLVANTAKYLRGQRVIGVNTNKALFDGILVPFSTDEAISLLAPAMHGETRIQSRTMVEATLDDGQRLLALNELFLGHHSHQSARYQIMHSPHRERQSSSGIIISTGTGATGWARSIHESRKDPPPLPKPEDRQLAYFVREAFPSVATGTDISSGQILEHETLHVRSEMNENGVIFGDGIETDYLDFNWGRQVSVGIAKETLELVTG